MAPPVTYIPRVAQQASNPKSEDEIAAALLDIDKLSQALLEADGDPGLVAERILGSRALEYKVLAAMSSDATSLDSFQVKVRAYAMMKLMQVYNTLQASVLLRLDEIKPDEALKQLIKLASVMGDLSDRKVSTTNVNVTESLLKMLPPQIASDVGTLIEMHNTNGGWQVADLNQPAQVLVSDE